MTEILLAITIMCGNGMSLMTQRCKAKALTCLLKYSDKDIRRVNDYSIKYCIKPQLKRTSHTRSKGEI